MKKSMVYASAGVAVLVIIASFSSAIGFSSTQSQIQSDTTPLFVVRRAQSNNEPIKSMIESQYLGKGRSSTLFPSSQGSAQSLLDSVINLLMNNPSLVKTLCKKLSNSPQVIRLLKTYGLRVSDVENCIVHLQEHPEIVKDHLMESDILRILDSPQPRDLSTSSVIGCLVVILALLPLAVVVGILVATITIVTCLNLGGCAEEIIRAILEGISQGLIQP
jgi:hypothetical protein